MPNFWASLVSNNILISFYISVLINTLVTGETSTEIQLVHLLSLLHLILDTLINARIRQHIFSALYTVTMHIVTFGEEKIHKGPKK